MAGRSAHVKEATKVLQLANKPDKLQQAKDEIQFGKESGILNKSPAQCVRKEEDLRKNV